MVYGLYVGSGRISSGSGSLRGYMAVGGDMRPVCVRRYSFLDLTVMTAFGSLVRDGFVISGLVILTLGFVVSVIAEMHYSV